MIYNPFLANRPDLFTISYFTELDPPSIEGEFETNPVLRLISFIGKNPTGWFGLCQGWGHLHVQRDNFLLQETVFLNALNLFWDFQLSSMYISIQTYLRGQRVIK